MATERIVVGGSVAALVAAEALAATGRPVRLLLPERGVGGGFAALRHGDRTLELGARLLELSYEDDDAPVPPLRDYAPGIGAHRPYARMVSAWVSERVGDRLREIPRPTMVLDGRPVDDILFTVDLERFAAALHDDERATMATEVERALAAAGDPAGVLAPGRAGQLAEMSLEQASLANHGAAFHERIVAPLCDKVLRGGARTVLAPWRRKAWAPIFHPATLLSALRGQRPAFRPCRTFHTVAPDGCAALVDEQLRRLEAEPRIRVERAGSLAAVRRDHGRTLLGFSGGAVVRAQRPVVGVGGEELFGAAGVAYGPERARTAIAWIDAPSEALTGLHHLAHVLDPDNPVLRVSVGGGGAPPGRTPLCIELRHDLDERRLADAARAGLVAAGLLRADAATSVVLAAARPSFAVPSRATRDAFAAARAELDRRRLDAELVGAALDLGADSLNEQIVQGLRVGEIAQ